MSSLKILQHNGIDILNYPEKNWLMAPFPKQKSPIYNNDNFATVNRAYFKDDKKFQAALNDAKSAWKNTKRDISWRLHVLIWAFGIALARKGKKIIFVELGTGKGYMARGVASFYAKDNFNGYLFDTFLPNLPDSDNNLEIDKDKRFAYASHAKDVFVLEKEINKYGDKFKLIKGHLPQSINNSALGQQKIDFLHIDLNHAVAEQETLKDLAPNIDSNTVILFDDTGAPGSKDQQIVHADFAMKINKQILYLPTGQALIV
jgi:hypothetical protein